MNCGPGGRVLRWGATTDTAGVVPMSYVSYVSRRYFTLFMNLLNDCSEVEDEGQAVGGRKRGMSRRLASLRHCTVLAMSNLLNANVDSGLMHSIGALEMAESTGALTDRF